ncbi:hypothetical protein H4R33_003820 [Dimargaris cristalligena]|uniref:Uncharacterized protein n=1 Tax=Dimargaris cristalligena TaxID=215637 RepID=A0A4V1J4Z0_9FUNG|nr:hypothetical protein H4R33_003820 [Dimargaris cristalligena]RKP37229.1 hypothetical protein BJ085DRAFT_37379 [Dimargaris cristalligena]|eukprot:RKP37229.1 hypothetical protein BJ085DRAFT_37379 [Dimargaris cristalligena]
MPAIVATAYPSCPALADSQPDSEPAATSSPNPRQPSPARRVSFNLHHNEILYLPPKQVLTQLFKAKDYLRRLPLNQSDPSSPPTSSSEDELLASPDIEGSHTSPTPPRARRVKPLKLPQNTQPSEYWITHTGLTVDTPITAFAVRNHSLISTVGPRRRHSTPSESGVLKSALKVSTSPTSTKASPPRSASASPKKKKAKKSGGHRRR